ncbi:MAG: hypothetical protein EOO67_03280 [Microbacterium sp.]|nr:MAG: hypothetical protein EOO67_03280 [Microbacterium sp.]
MTISDISRTLVEQTDEPSVTLAGYAVDDLVAEMNAASSLLTSSNAPAAGIAPEVVIQRVIEAIAVRPEGVRRVAAWIDANSPTLTPAQLHRAANRVAWITRGSDEKPQAFRDTTGSLWSAWVHLERFRFAFDAPGIRQYLDSLPPEAINRDVLLGAFRAFHSIRTTTDSAEAERAITSALSGDFTEHAPAVFDIVAHAVWLNHSLDRQGQLLQHVCDVAMSTLGELNVVLTFRYATALRLQGDYSGAIKKAEAALARLRGGTEFVRTFSEQLLREREMSVASQYMDRRQAETTRALEGMERKIDDMDHRSVARVIEIVTLFTAIVAFAFGGGGAALGDPARSARDTLIVIAGFGLALASFAAAVYFLVEGSLGDRARRKRVVWPLAVILGIGLVQLVGLYVVGRSTL